MDAPVGGLAQVLGGRELGMHRLLITGAIRMRGAGCRAVLYCAGSAHCHTKVHHKEDTRAPGGAADDDGDNMWFSRSFTPN